MRIIGDVSEPARVVIELGGTLRWSARGGALAGVTLRRPRATRDAQHALRVEPGATLGCSSVVVDNEGGCAGCAAVCVTQGGFLYLERCAVSRATQDGVRVEAGGACAARRSTFHGNARAGLSLAHGSACAVLTDCVLTDNAHHAATVGAHATLALRNCDCRGYDDLQHDLSTKEKREPVHRQPDARLFARDNLGLNDSAHVLHANSDSLSKDEALKVLSTKHFIKPPPHTDHSIRPTPPMSTPTQNHPNPHQPPLSHQPSPLAQFSQQPPPPGYSQHPLPFYPPPPRLPVFMPFFQRDAA